MKVTVGEIARWVGGTVLGDENTLISNAAGLEDATSNDISFLKDASNSKLLESFHSSSAGAVLVKRGFEKSKKTTIQVENPLGSFCLILKKIYDEKNPSRVGIHPQASVSPSAKIGKNVYVGAFCVIEDDATIGDNACLMGQNYVGRKTNIGEDTLLYPQVILREEVTVGARCILHSGVVVGSDGYGFFFAQGKHNKIPQVGNVHIEDDVEIGSCTTIDRATTGTTRIGRGTKIDNLVQVAHNVDIGPHSLLVAQVGIGGSCSIGAGSVLGGQVGMADHVSIGPQTQVGGKSGITHDLEGKKAYFGTPAQPLKEAFRQISLVQRLPELFKEMKILKEKIFELTSTSKNH